MTGQETVVCRLDEVCTGPTGAPHPFSEHCQMGEGRWGCGGFSSQGLRSCGLRGKVLLNAREKSQAATMTSHLLFKDEYPHVWAMSGCQVGQ